MRQADGMNLELYGELNLRVEGPDWAQTNDSTFK